VGIRYRIHPQINREWALKALKITRINNLRDRKSRLVDFAAAMMKALMKSLSIFIIGKIAQCLLNVGNAGR
jgi:hypothetical protein